jgi:hypothetical protein
MRVNEEYLERLKKVYETLDEQAVKKRRTRLQG